MVASGQGQLPQLVGVVRDSAGSAISGAEVAIPALGLRLLTDASGVFRTPVEPGRHVVVTRKLGFAVRDDTVSIEAGENAPRTLVLSRRIATVDPMTATAGLTPHMRRFEEHRSSGMGTYITPAELRAADNLPLRTIMTRKLPGMVFVAYKSSTFVRSSRGGDSRRLIRALPADTRSPTGCWLQIFVDGTRVYAPDGRADAADVEDFVTRDVAAIEFYSGPAETPPEYNSTGASCGTLVFWMRHDGSGAE
jgi:hypothetical protein